MLILNFVFTTNVLSCFAEAFAILSILDMETTTICNLVTEVTSHHFCCILLIRSQSLGSTVRRRGLYKGVNNKRQGSQGGVRG